MHEESRKLCGIPKEAGRFMSSSKNIDVQKNTTPHITSNATWLPRGYPEAANVPTPN